MSASLSRRVREYGLTAGTLGSNGAQTVMIVLLPVLLEPFAPSALWIGMVIGSEGLLAILVPYWVGTLSDALPRPLARRFGRRAFFLWATAPPMVAALAVTPFLDGFWLLAAAGFVFFATLHGYMTPLWALVIDAVPDERRGPVQGVRGIFQALGLGFGLIGGGLMFSLWQPLPFLLAGLLVLVSTYFTVASVPEDRRAVRPAADAEAGEGHDGRAEDEEGGDAPDGAADAPDPGPLAAADPETHLSFWRRLTGRAEVLWFLIANALWTGAVDGVRPYVFIFASVVLGISIAEASLVLGCLLGGLAIGAVIIGWLGNRVGRARLLAAAAALTGLAMGAGVFVRDVPAAIAVLAVAGVAAAAFIALPFPLFARLAGEEAAGRNTAVFIVSVGIARVLAPILVGAAIDLGAGVWPDLQGYPAMWPVAGFLALLSVPPLLRSVAIAPGEPGRPGD